MRLFDDFQPLYQLYSCTCRFPPVAPKRFIRWCPFLVLTHVLGQKRIRCLGEDLRSASKKRFSVLLLLLSMIHQRRICSISIISLRSSASALLLVTVDGSHQISRVASEGDTNLASYSDSTTSFELQFGALKNGYAYDQ